MLERNLYTIYGPISNFTYKVIEVEKQTGFVKISELVTNTTRTSL